MYNRSAVIERAIKAARKAERVAVVYKRIPYAGPVREEPTYSFDLMPVRRAFDVREYVEAYVDDEGNVFNVCAAMLSTKTRCDRRTIRDSTRCEFHSAYEVGKRNGRADRLLGLSLDTARTASMPGYAEGYNAGQKEK